MSQSVLRNNKDILMSYTQHRQERGLEETIHKYMIKEGVKNMQRAVFGLSISKVFVNFREGEIRAKIGHFRYSSDIRVVLPDL